MKISSNMDYDRGILDNFPFGIIVLDKENRINHINTYLTNLLVSEKMNPQTAEVQTILNEPIVEEVKQTHQDKEKLDYLLPEYVPVMTRYHPLLDEQETLQGVIIFIELYSALKQRLHTYTDYDVYQELIAIIREAGSNRFRVLTTNSETWLETKKWKEEWSFISEEVTRRIDHLSEQTVTNRREIIGKFLIQRNQTFTPAELISKPLLIKGKLIGSIQFLQVKNEEYYQEEIRQVKKLVRKLEKTKRLEDLIGEGTEIKLAYEQAKLLKDLKEPLLILGEKGTGKTTLAKAIHLESNRRDNPFITVNTHSLKDKENFASFIHYIQKRANGGTVFVRTQSSMSTHLQRYLFQMVNECESTHFIFGITERIEEKKWQEGTKSLLQKYQIMLPPLRNRPEDIPLLVEGLMFYFNQKYHMNIMEIEEKAIEYWQRQKWPQNITQLESELENIIAACDSFTEVLTLSQITKKKEEEATFSGFNQQMSLQQAIDQFEKEYIDKALRSNRYNKTKTAKSLNISVRSLYYKMDKYRMDRDGGAT